MRTQSPNFRKRRRVWHCLSLSAAAWATAPHRTPSPPWHRYPSRRGNHTGQEEDRYISGGERPSSNAERTGEPLSQLDPLFNEGQWHAGKLNRVTQVRWSDKKAHHGRGLWFVSQSYITLPCVLVSTGTPLPLSNYTVESISFPFLSFCLSLLLSFLPSYQWTKS